MFGILKQSPIVTFLPYVDIIWDMDWNTMHGVFLNVTLCMLQLLFSEDNQDRPFSLFHKKTEADKLIKGFYVPHSHSRPLYQFEKFSEWKSSKLRYFAQKLNFLCIFTCFFFTTEISFCLLQNHFSNKSWLHLISHMQKG